MKFNDIPDFISHSLLLDTIDQYQIWSLIIPNVTIDKWIKNPLRVDKNLGSCRLTWYNNKLLLVDWADKEQSHIDCITAYKKLYPNKKWVEIISDLSRYNINSRSNHTVHSVHKNIQEKDIIIPIKKEWDKKALEYWEKRYLTEHDLIFFNVYNIDGYKIIKPDGNVKEVYVSDLGFSYECNNKYKLYFPTKNTYRFIGNMGRNDIWHTHKNNILLICKSHKDYMLSCKFLNCSVTHVQGENWGHPQDHIIMNWEINYDQIFILLDKDEAGISGSKRLASKFLKINPNILFIDNINIKDTDEFILKHSPQIFINWFENKINSYCLI